MSLFGGPIDGLLVLGALVVAVAAWLVRPRRLRGPRLMSEGDDGIDHEALEAAEREVRDLGKASDRNPDRPDQGDGFGDDAEDDDWGPGTARRPRSPLQL